MKADSVGPGERNNWRPTNRALTLCKNTTGATADAFRKGARADLRP